MFQIAKLVTQRAIVTNLCGRGALTAATRTFSAAAKDAQNSADISTKNTDEPVDIPNPFEREPQQCILCKHNITPNYKNTKLLSQFQSPYTGRIYGRHITGLCKQKQEDVEKAILRAQQCLLMPGYHKDLDYLQDPKLFDPEKAVRPHKY